MGWDGMGWDGMGWDGGEGVNQLFDGVSCLLIMPGLRCKYVITLRFSFAVYLYSATYFRLASLLRC